MRVTIAGKIKGSSSEKGSGVTGENIEITAGFIYDKSGFTPTTTFGKFCNTVKDKTWTSKSMIK